jgi:hypothetical protein
MGDLHKEQNPHLRKAKKKSLLIREGQGSLSNTLPYFVVIQPRLIAGGYVTFLPCSYE